MEKYLNKRLIIWFVTILFIGAFTSCDKGMYEVSSEYSNRGEDLYLGVVDSIKIMPGYNRVKFSWEIKADPRTTKTLIYWNNRLDSASVNVVRTSSGRIAMQYELNNLPELDYIFEFVAKNDKGLFSLPKQAATRIYGDVYVKNLRNRSTTSVAKLANGDVSINWNPIASSSIVYTTLKYQSAGGSMEVKVANTDTQTILKGVIPGSSIKVSTSFLPVGSLDVFNALNEVIFVMP